MSYAPNNPNGQASSANSAPVVIASDQIAIPVTAQQAALTKAMQGATGVTTQDLKDAGRSSKAFTLDGYAVASTAEVLVPFNISTDNGAVASVTSYAVSAGKRLRLQQLFATLHTIGGNTTVANVIIRLSSLDIF